MASAKLIGIYLEQERGEIEEGSLEALSHALKLARMTEGKTAALLIGDCLEDAAQARKPWGLDEVHFYEIESHAKRHPLPYARAAAQFVEHNRPDIFLFGTTPLARELAVRVAAHHKASFLADCSFFEIDEGHRLKVLKPAIGGACSAVLAAAPGNLCIATVLPGSCPPMPKGIKAAPKIFRHKMAPDPADMALRLLSFAEVEEGFDEIADAQVIVAGGAGMGTRENFNMLYRLASLLGGTVAGTRKAADRGWIPSEGQIGLSGRMVSPKIYIAFGISGAVHHRVGMQSSRSIVAVNSDPYAPIFNVADLGIVSRAEVILPLMIAKLEADFGKRA